MPETPPPHETLQRQLRRCGLDVTAPPQDPAAWTAFLAHISQTYCDSDQERYLLQESMDASSLEMEALYKSLRQRSETRIESERNRLRAVIENLGAGLCLLDSGGRITAINAEVTHLLGWSSVESEGMSVAALFERGGDQCVARVRAGETDRDENAIFLARSGLDVPVRYAVNPVLAADGAAGAVLVFSDMTEVRRAATALSQARDEAVEGARVKSEFLANMSHEIRTPMNGVLGMANMLLDTDLDPEQVELTETLRGCSQSLLGILNDILDVSKMEAGKMTFDPEPMNLVGLIEESVRMLESTAAEKGVRLSFEAPASFPALVEADAVRVRQVLLNLVGNGIKFSEGGSVELSMHDIRGDARNVRFRMDVRDTGIGIPADRLAQIFESFTQADGSTTRQFGGTGLGLTITRRLVELMGGELGVHSVEGEGSTFWFRVRLPVVRNAPAEPVPVGEEEVGRPCRVLLVEDNAVNLRIATRLIEKLGHQVESATNGQEALDQLHSAASFDMVLMDVQMPVMDGFEATGRWRAFEDDRADGKRLPILAMTAHAMAGDRERCLAQGMDDYITKPLDLAALQSLLATWSLAPAARSLAGS